MKNTKNIPTDSIYASAIYRLAYNKYIKFYLHGNKEDLEEVKSLINTNGLDISEQDLLWWKSYKYEKWVEFREKQK